jgi:Arc/MetJ family transcription regulator
VYQQYFTWYIRGMSHRTSIDLDEVLLSECQRILGTGGIRDTVEGAMNELVRADRRARLKQRILTGEGIDRGPETLAASRPTR